MNRAKGVNASKKSLGRLAALEYTGAIVKGLAMDLTSLDRRKFERSIAQEMERINSRPIELSALINAKSIIESELNYLTGLSDVTTANEGHELEAKLGCLRTRLARTDAEIAAHNNEQKVEPEIHARSVAPGAASDAPTLDNDSMDYVPLLKQVLLKLRQVSQSAEVVLEAWLEENKLSRTTVTDYRAGKIKGRVSSRMRQKIEDAIVASAEKLGLPTRTMAD